jgi:hypothetical protein
LSRCGRTSCEVESGGAHRAGAWFARAPATERRPPVRPRLGRGRGSPGYWGRGPARSDRPHARPG